MKSIFKIFLLALGVCSTVFSQIPEIKRLAVQEISQSVKESAPVWLTENILMIFFLNETRDTIFSTKSTNGGKNWLQPKVVQIISLPIQQYELGLATLKTTSGRILLAWSINSESMKLIYSNDQGNSWSQPISILGGGSPPVLQRSSRDLNLSQWRSGEICLSFTGFSTQKSYYKLSSDDGITWSVNPFDFPEQENIDVYNLSINSVGDNTLLAVYEINEVVHCSIYSRSSTDNGLNWSNPKVIADEIRNVRRPKVAVLENGNIITAYLRDIVNQIIVDDDADIFYKISSDAGVNWATETRFTKYIGQDSYINLTSFQNKVFISFATERFSVSHQNESNYQTAYGILGESTDQFTPPKVYSALAPPEFVDVNNNKFVYQARVVDDEAVGKVLAVMEDSIYIGEMFDDGIHYDGEANDSVFGNVFPIIYPRYLDGYRINVNKLNLPLDNKGILADVNVSYGQKTIILSNDAYQNQSVYNKDILFAGGSSGLYEEGSFLFSAGFFLSGYVNGNLFANGVASGVLVDTYLPGIIGSDPDDSRNVLYVINKNDPPFGSSWQKWKEAVLLGADFYDGNRDGIYNPIDQNLNRTWDMTEDMPPLIGDEIVWCVYNDGVPSEQRRTGFEIDPLRIEVQQTLFATDNPELENVIFIKYKVNNTGLVSDVLDSVFFSPWDDTDLGDASDDYGGCDTLLQSVFTYNHLDDQVYGNNPPAIFTSILQGPAIESNKFSDTAYTRNGSLLGEQILPGYKNLGLFSFAGYAKASPPQGDPVDIDHVWNYVHARDREGNLLTPCDSAWGYVYGNINCSDVNPMFWFSGDPVNKVGWLDIQASDDRKFSSTGPFTLEKGKPQEIIIAYVMGRGTDPLNSITIARENVQRAIQEYQSNFSSMTYSAPPASNPVTSYILYQNYPNPFNPTTTIRYELPQDGVVTIEVFDILGQRVGTLINEYQKADRYEVTFNRIGLASGVYIYQLRAGDFIQSKKMLLLK